MSSFIVGSEYILNSNYKILLKKGILVEKDKIKEIEDYDKLCKKHQNVNHTYYKNTILVPGYTNFHHHLEYSFYRSLVPQSNYFSWIENLSKLKREISVEDKKNSILYGIMHEIKNGVTNTVDFSTDCSSLEPLISSGLNGKIFWELIGDKQFEKVRDKFINILPQGTDNVTLNIGCHTLYSCSLKTVESALALSVMYNTFFAIHCSETCEEYKSFINKDCRLLRDIYSKRSDLLQYGSVSPIEFFCRHFGSLLHNKILLVHCNYLCDKDFDYINYNNLIPVCCPESSLYLSNDISAIINLLKYKYFSIGIGTDSLASCLSGSIYEQIRLFELLQRLLNKWGAVSPVLIRKCLAMATYRVFGIKQVLEIGAKANIVGVAIDKIDKGQKEILNQFLYEKNNVVLNICNGNLLYSYGEYKTVDVEQIIWNYNKYSNRR